MKLRTTAKVVRLTSFFVILLISTQSAVNSSPQTQHDIQTSGAIAHPNMEYVSIDPNTIVAINNLALGFQLDGRDISAWRTRSALRELAEDANFQLVRFFPQRLDEPCNNFPNSWDWTTIDDLVEKIFVVGAEPMPALGFCGTYGFSSPGCLPTNPATDAPYPSDFAEYCLEWVKHFKAANLPVRYYELVNEPHHWFGWGGTDETKRSAFKEIFNQAAQAMRTENPNVLIGNDNSMVQSNKLNEWMAANLDLDFLSWHRYISGNKAESDASLIEKAETNEGCTYGPGNFIDPARQDYYNAKGIWLPVIQSEGNLNYAWTSGTDPRMQTMLGGVTTALSMKLLVMENVSYNLHFDFAGRESADENFGMVSLDDNEPWPSYHVQYLIGNNLAKGDIVIESESSMDDITSLAWIHNNVVNVLLVCKVQQTRTIYVLGAGGDLSYFRLDNSHLDLQSGILNAGSALTMDGYSVVLLQQSVPS